MAESNLKACFSVGPFHPLSTSIKYHLSSKQSSFFGCLSPKAIYHQRLSSIKGRPSSKVVFYKRLSSIKGCLPSKVVFHQRCLPSMVVILQKDILNQSCLPSKVVFHERCSKSDFDAVKSKFGLLIE